MKEPVLEHQRAPPPPPIRVICPAIAAGHHEAHRAIDQPLPEDEQRVPWNCISRRLHNLQSFPVTVPAHRANYRSQNKAVMQRGCITNPNKSLNVLREFLQPQINREIQELMQKYIDGYFKPAMVNIRQNNGGSNGSNLSDQHIQSICQRILDESKKMFSNSGSGLNSRSQSPVICERTATKIQDRLDSDYENNHLRPPMNHAAAKKRTIQQQQRPQNSNHGSNSDSEQDSNHPTIHSTPQRGGPRKKKRKGGAMGVGSASKGPKISKMSHHPVKAPAVNVPREGPRWDPNRLTATTKFVLGSKANKALGFGMTRGRLYTKHTDLFRYIGDAEDKLWLSENGLMPPAGGRAYLLVKEDIEDLINSPEYFGQPGVNATDMGEGFTVPEYIIKKMQEHMESLRSMSQISATPAEAAEPNEPIDAALDLSNDNSKPPSSVDSVRPERPESGLCASSLEDLELHSQELSAGASPFSPSNLAAMSPLDMPSGPNSH